MVDGQAGSLAARTALGPLARPGRLGRPDGGAGITLGDCAGLAVIEVVCRRLAEPFGALIAARFGMALPEPRRFAAADGLTLLWAGPGRWRLIGDPARLAEPALRAAFGDAATIADRSGGFGILSLAGPAVRDALAKGIAVDLHPRAFRPGDTALTLAERIPIQIWQTEETPCYEIAFPRSTAGAFWSWLVAQAAFAGVDVT